MKWVVLRRGLVWSDELDSEEECLEEIWDDTHLRNEPRNFYTHMTQPQFKKWLKGEDV